MACFTPLKGYKNANGALTFKRGPKTVGQMEVACGQCLGCRIDRTLMWAMRITHESSLYEDNCFITLTYRSIEECNEKQYKKRHYVPDDYSLNYHHFREFIRRLRRHFPQKIRYFHCGEYGEENLRPHYHACLFNVTFDDQCIYQQEQGVTTYESATLQNLWPYGFCTIGELNFETASYTAAYIQKKINGKKALDKYLRNDEYGVAYWVKPPYITMSLKPGIGADFYDKFKTDFFPSDESPVPGKGIIKKVPRYYADLLSKQNPKLLAVVKNARQKYFGLHREDFTPDRLRQKYICARAQQTQRQRAL